MSNYQALGPFRMELELSFNATGDRRSATGTANFQFAFGHIPTEQDVLVAIGESLSNIGEQLPGHDVELMPASQFLNDVVVPELCGGQSGNFAVPGYCNYDSGDLYQRAMAAYAAKCVADAAAKAPETVQ